MKCGTAKKELWSCLVSAATASHGCFLLRLGVGWMYILLNLCSLKFDRIVNKN